MRVVKVVGRGGDAGEALELHDHLTVIRGLDGTRRAWFLDVVGRFGASSADGATGEIEVAGVLLPLDGESVDMLGIDGRHDGVIDGRRLLGCPSTWSEPDPLDPSGGATLDLAAGAGADVAVDGGRATSPDAFGEIVAGATAGDVDPVDSWFRDPADPSTAAPAPAASPSSDLERPRPAREGDPGGEGPGEGGTGSAASQGDPSGPPTNAAPGGGSVPSGGASVVAAERADTPLLRRIGALEARRLELEELSDSIGSSDLASVRAALDDLEGAPVDVPLPEASELADAWSDLQKDLKGIALGTSEEEQRALDAVAVARQAVEEAEAVLAKPQLTDEQMARIEAAHAAYLEASDKVERRFGGNRARRQLADAEAEETRLLSRFGFDSWVDYVISASRRTEDPELTSEHEILEAAQVELEICIAELDAIPGAVGRRHRRVRLRDQERDLSDRVARLLGHEPVGDEVVPELLALRTRYEPQVEVEALISAMAAAGVEVDGARSQPELLVARARQALAVQDQADRRRSELLVAVDALRGAVEVLRAAAAAGATTVPSMPPLPDMAEPPVSLVDAVADDLPPVEESSGGDGAPAPQAVGTGDGTEGEGEDESPAPDPRAAGGQVAADGEIDVEVDAEVEVEDADLVQVDLLQVDVGQAAGASPDDAVVAQVDLVAHPDRAALLDDVQWEAMSAMASLRSDGPAGQLPVVFDEAFSMLDGDECLGLLSRLVRFTDHVQMVVLTDRPEVAEWATAIGEDHARVIEVVS